MQVTAKARVGFAGPAVILNTVYGMDQGAYDANCPQGFQSAAWLQASPMPFSTLINGHSCENDDETTAPERRLVPVFGYHRTCHTA